MVNPANNQPLITAAQYAQQKGGQQLLQNPLPGLRPLAPAMIPSGIGNVIRGGGFQ
jgi:hypothetical protein